MTSSSPSPGAGPGRPPTVAVLGGGIAGLSAAWELCSAGVRVVVLEAASRLGGKIGAAELGGRSVELGPDAFVARRPEAVTLCRELGLADELVAPGSRTSYLWSGERLHPLPAGLALGIPTRLGPLASAGILSPAGLGRAAIDLCTPPWASTGLAADDEAIGPLLARRLGREVVDLLADPLIGGIHAGSVDTMSAAAVFPPLLEAAAARGSLMRNLRPFAGSSAPGSPVFLSPRRGISDLVDRLAGALGERGAALRTDTTVRALARRPGGGWLVHAGDDDMEADGLVVALPATVAAKLLGDVDQELGSLLGAVRYSSVTLVTLRFAPGDVGAPLDGTGYLVPRVGGKLLTACTWLSSKWPELARPDDVLVRVSTGHFGDDRHASLGDGVLVEQAVAELAPALELGGPPLEWRVTRFDDAFPQYEVGHPTLVSSMEKAAAHAGIALAGAVLRGVGIPACIGSGRAAALTALARLAAPTRR